MIAYLATALITVIALASGLWATYTHGEEAGRARVQQLWDQDSARRAVRIADAQIILRATEHALTVAAAKQLKAKNAELARTRHFYAAELERLRDRPTARAGDGGVPEGTAAGVGPAVGCTGAQLSRPDSIFLLGEATRADQLRIALTACVAHADAVERELNGAPRVK